MMNKEQHTQKHDTVERTFESDGMMWSDGEIPECSYCKRNFYDAGEILFETPLSGGLVCEDQECRDALLQDILYNEVKETTRWSKK